MYVVLQRGKKTMEEPSPFTLLTVGQTTKESVVRAATTEPRWEQNFRFFVANPNHQNLDIEVSIISVASSAAAFEFASASNGQSGGLDEAVVFRRSGWYPGGLDEAVIFRRSGWSLGGLDKGCGLEKVWMVCRRCG